MSEDVANWFPTTTIDSDEVFPIIGERLGLVLRGGRRVVARQLNTDSPTIFEGVAVTSGLPLRVSWAEIELIIFLDRPMR